MNEKLSLPPALQSVIGADKTEFIVKSRRKHPKSYSWSVIIFSFIWLTFCSVFLVIFALSEEGAFFSKMLSADISFELFWMIGAPVVIIGFFILIGLLMLINGIWSFFQKGGYFVGTSNRLITYRKGKIRSIDWEQFSGEIEVSGEQDLGSLILTMRTGRMVRRSKQREELVPDKICMVGIQNPFAVEKICRQRIKENDPTPSKSYVF